MKFSLKIYLALIFIFISGNIFGQQVVLSGTVTDKTFGDPLTGANIYIVNQSNRALGGVMADINGEYHIRIPDQKGLRVVFSFIGFVTQTVEYKGQEKLNIQLVEQAEQLKGVEVTAAKVERSSMGLSRKQIVAATQKVTMENLETAPVANVADALQGALANVDILTGAEPGGKTSIRIRGTSSLNASSEPLIVLDGVPFPAEISDDFNFATADSEDYGSLLNISPQDIESIETLKDAAATAIWGSRGANGVLLITTKKGAKGKIKFSFSTKGEFRKEGSTIPLLNGSQYCSLIQDAIWNTVNDLGTGSTTTTNYLQMIFNENQINFNPNYVYFDEYNQNTNWVDEVTQNGLSIDNTFSMSGGGDKATYRFSMGYLDESGTTIGTGFKRFSTRFNMRYNFSDRLDITTDFSFNRGQRDASWTGNSVSTPRNMAIMKMPNESPYVINEDGSRSREYFTLYENFQGTWNEKWYNPVAMVNEARNRTLNYDNALTVNLHYRLLDGLDYRGYVSLKANTTDNNKFLPNTATGVPYTNSWYNQTYETESDRLYIATENKLTYVNVKNLNHQIVATAAVQTTDQKNSSMAVMRSGSASSSLDDAISGIPSGLGSSSSTTRSVGLVSNVNYTFLGKYLVNAGYRMEGNSSVGEDERWGGFWTLGGAWHFCEEDFLGLGEKAPWMSTGKIRYSWGQSGNSPSGTSPYVGTFTSLGNYIGMTGVYPSKIQLNKLKWETVTSNNLGLDLGFFNDQFTLSAEIYDKITTDLLQKNYTVPSTVGSSIAWYNSGKMTNQGWELMIGWNKKINKDWRFTANFNISQNFNKVNELPENKLEENFSFGNGNYASKVVSGDPLGSFYGFKYNGVYQNVEETYARDAQGNIMYNMKGEPVIMKNGNQKVYPGDAKYADTNNDGVIDKYDIVYLGNAMPTLTAGIQLSLNYKTWALSTNLHGRSGQKVINAVRMDMESMYNKNNQSTAVLRRWRNEGDNTDIPRALYGKGYNYLGSDRFVEDASFLRIKTVTLRYQLPKKMVEQWSLSKVQVYVTGYDLYTFTNYKGQDPEINISGSPYVVAKDGAKTPKPIRVAFGINLDF